MALAWTAGCDLLSTDPESEQGPSGPTGTDGGGHEQESPLLAERVRSGNLPSVRKRMPRKPLVIKTTGSTGSYGGTWNSWMRDESSRYQPELETGYDYLVRWDPGYQKPIPNLATWQTHRAGREWLFHLRPGTRWSDGEPFTADDIVFAYDGILQNKDVYPALPAVFKAGGAPASLDKVDAHTVRFTFKEPYGFFAHLLCTPPGGGYLLAPRHYLKQFHPEYNQKVQQSATKSGYDSWTELLLAKDDILVNPDRPVLNAWRVTTPLGKNTRLALERNPYYWKTDPKGRQLPYLDKVVYPRINNIDTVVLKTASGEIDFNHPRANPSLLVPDNKPVLARGRKKGGYDFTGGLSSSNNQMVICLNLTHKDPDYRGVFNDRRFRMGLSSAIDRHEMINAVYQRQGEPWQAAPGKQSPFYSEKLAKQYTDYDPDRANDILDQAGYGERDGKGIRLLPGSRGKPISFQIDVSSDQPTQIDALELIKKYWAKVGVEIESRTVSRSLFQERKAANLPDASVWGGAGGVDAELLDPRYYFAYSGASSFAVPWATWYTSGGQDGERPPKAARQQMKLYDRALATVDDDTRSDLLTRLLELAQEQFWCIGTVLPTAIYGTVRKTFHNTPGQVRAAWMLAPPGPTRPEQYWKES